MKKTLFLLALLVIVLSGMGCGGEDGNRIAALEKMPVLWESEIVAANPDMPDLDHFSVMYDSHDASLAQAWSKDKFTDDYIPEPVMAFKSETYRNKPRDVTIHMGDTVSIMAHKKNNTSKEVCLIRTRDNTYAWVYAFHFLDKNGDRMGRWR